VHCCAESAFLEARQRSVRYSCEAGSGRTFNPALGGFPVETKLLATNNQQQQQRYRISFSDGTHTTSGILATQLNELVINGSLAEGTILRLDEVLPNSVGNKK
jgi:Replication factor-A protein 1, N-terminal domain